MRECFNDFQIPCRWSANLSYGYGSPIFNYYSALPYYLGGVVSLFVGYVWAAKMLFLLPIIFGALGMCFFARELFGEYGGVVSATLYTFVPYRALDTFVRGAVAESFALAILPFILFFVTKLARSKTRGNFVGLILSLFALFVTHNISTLIFTPVILLWTLYSVYQNGVKSLRLFIYSFVLAFGMASFFVIPAFLEKGLVTTESLIVGDLDYRNHFAGVRQLFLDNTWGYGASVRGTLDGLSFQIGIVHWLIVLVAVGLIVLYLFKRRKSFVFGIPVFFILLFLFSIFMTHNKSHRIWESLSLLPYIQFPWRFLGMTAIATSLLGGFIVYTQKGILQKLLGVLILIAVVALNLNYFRPEKFYFDVTDETKLTGSLWEEQQKGAILDYLPQTAIEPKEKAGDVATTNRRDLIVGYFLRSSNYWEFEVVNGEAGGLVTIPVFNFPGWEAPGFTLATSMEGTIVVIGAKKGDIVRGYFKDTDVRTVANLLTLFSLIALVFLVFNREKNEKYFE